MPIEIVPASPTLGFVEVRLRDAVTQSEFDAAAIEIAPSLHRWARVLVDATALTNAPDVLTMLLRAPCRGQWPADVRQAAVVRPQAAAVARPGPVPGPQTAAVLEREGRRARSK